MSAEARHGREAAIRLHEGQLHVAQALVKARLECLDVPAQRMLSVLLSGVLLLPLLLLLRYQS